MSPSNRRPSDSKETDIFDDLWSSLTDSATELTRSLVGLPMFYRRHRGQTDHQDDAITIFAEPGILSPKIITFHLDKDVDGLVGPFRFVTRPVSVFDVFSQDWNYRDGRCGSGIMFLFGSPVENARWLVSPELKFTGNSMFRQWNRPDEWIRRSTVPQKTLLR